MLEVYDKAQYHYEGTFPPDLSYQQAYVHMGMFLGWACRNNLISQDVEDDFFSEIQHFNNNNIKPAELMRLLGGTLASDMLNSQGKDFAKYYYVDGDYIDDYMDTLSLNLSSIYHVEDTWESFLKISQVISDRFNNWLLQ